MTKHDDIGSITPANDERLFGDVAGLIESARSRAAAALNSELVMVYWSVGKRVREDVLGGERAAYGQEVVKRLAARLTERYGRGYSRQSIFRMMRAAELYPEVEILSTLSTISNWSHFVELLTLSDQRKRDFYAAFADHERWSVRTLRTKIAGKLYERTLAVME